LKTPSICCQHASVKDFIDHFANFKLLFQRATLHLSNSDDLSLGDLPETLKTIYIEKRMTRSISQVIYVYASASCPAPCHIIHLLRFCCCPVELLHKGKQLYDRDSPMLLAILKF